MHSTSTPSSIELADRLHSAAIHLLRSLRREDDRTGLSAPRLSALSVVVFTGPVKLVDLAGAEQVRPPTMTRLVQALESDGLVRRTDDKTDGRAFRITATAKGRRLLMEARKRRVRALTRRVNSLTKEEQRTLTRAVRLLERVAS